MREGFPGSMRSRAASGEARLDDSPGTRGFSRAQEPMDPETRLAELGLVLPPPPRPVAAYTTAVASGNLLFLSGTTCYVDGEPMFHGKVGSEVTQEQAYLAARQTALNLLAVVKAELGTLSRVDRI